VRDGSRVARFREKYTRVEWDLYSGFRGNIVRQGIAATHLVLPSLFATKLRRTI
jgi:hypothetical protein